MTVTSRKASKVEIRDATRQDIPALGILLMKGAANILKPLLDPTPTPEYIQYREQQIERFMIQREQGMPAKMDVAVDKESQNIVGLCFYIVNLSPQQRKLQEDKIKDMLPTPKFPSNGNQEMYQRLRDSIGEVAEMHVNRPVNHIMNLAVSQDYRGGGVGRILMEKACSSSQAPTYLESVPTAVQFYKRLQFVSCGPEVKLGGYEQVLAYPMIRETTTSSSSSKIEIRDAQRDDIPMMGRLLHQAFATHLESIVDPTPTPEYIKFREQQVERFMIQQEQGMPAKLDVAIDKESQRIVGFCLYYVESSPQERNKQEEQIKDKLITPEFPPNFNKEKFNYVRNCLIATAEIHEKHPINHIMYLGVDQNYRGGGVGSALIKKAVSSNKCSTYLDAVDTAVSFYKRLGFNICGTVIKLDGGYENETYPQFEVMIRESSE